MAVQQTTSQTILPAWYTDYAKSLYGRATAAAEQPYQPYNLPRIAPFSAEQQQAFAMAPGKAATYQPYLNTAANLATMGGTGSAYETVSPIFERATGSFTDPGVASRYMNPYIEQVVAGIGDTAARNLREKILPSVNRTFIGGGTFGGSRSAEFTQRAIRDAQSGALSAQVDALRQGYGQAADIYNTEANRGLTGASQAGSLVGQDYNRMIDAAQRIGALGEGAQSMGLREAATLEAIGKQRQDLGQRSADLSYGDFVAQRDYPFTQLQKMTQITGTPSATGQTVVNQAPGPSGTSQVLGTIGGIAGLIGATGGFDAGGWLSGLFKEGGKVSKKVPPMKSGLGWLKDKK
jgi:hypothetical protein